MNTQGIHEDIRALADLDLEGLRAAWRQRYGPPPRLRSPELLRHMLAWRIQAPGRCAARSTPARVRKEGLDQAFNSLHAQREACEAYIQSQTQEGWKALPAVYDDGG